MVTKPCTCPNGHQWSATDESKQCPICGAEAAETIADGKVQQESTEGGTEPYPLNKKLLHWHADLRGKTPTESQFGRYQIVDELGHGGMGFVYRAFDPVHERHVALKTLPSTDPARLSRFKREFRVLAGIDHPNVVKLFELTSDGETWFFTMEIVEGADLLHHIRYGNLLPNQAGSQPSEAENELVRTEVFNPFELSEEKQQRIRDTFAQLSEAVDALHGSGIIHRDIKPSNVIVAPDGRVVLLDFGLVAETDPSGIYQSLHQQVLGTAAYMSPEQAACEAVTAASDWYSVGTMLYQALTGKLPFSGTAVDVLYNKQRHRPVPPSEVEPSVARDWNDLCMVLLCRNPENRPPAKDILQRLAGRTYRAAPVRPSQPDGLALVGRESHLQLLDETWHAVRGGRAQTVLIEGRSGNGKSALVESFLDQATRDGAVVLKGRCYEMESVPFKATDSLIDSLVTHLTHLSPVDAAALMPRDVHALARLFPVLGQVESVASLPRRNTDAADQQELNRRAIGALRELLIRMGDRCPLIVYIDDLQWGDEDSAAMLSDLLQPPDPPVLLFLGTYRSEDVESSPFLQSFRLIQRQREQPLESLDLEVTPLDQEDSVKLVLTLLKSDDADAQRTAELVAREAAGNPFFVSEMVKYLQLDGNRVSRSTEPLDLVDMIWSRVQRLPDESQRLLAVVALWGQPLSLERAMRIAEVGQSAIGPLRSGHLIRTGGLTSSSHIETYHDRVRESVSARLAPATKQQHHLRIAEEYARESPLGADAMMDGLRECFEDGNAKLDDHFDVVAAWYDVAFHFDAAGRPDLSFCYALVSAEKVCAQFSLELAEQQYRIAERDVDHHDDVIRWRVAEGLGDVLMVRGNYDEAKVRFDRALELAPDSRARIESKLGELAFRQGDRQQAIELSERALKRLGEKVPGRSIAIYFRIAREVVVQLLHTSMPSSFVGRKKLGNTERQLLVVRIHIRLTYAYFFEHRELCLWHHLRAMNLAELYTPTLELAYAYAMHAPVMGLVAFFRRGIAYAEKSLTIYKSLGDLWGQGLALSYHGIVLYAASRYEECIEKSRNAANVLERAGDLWEVNVARVHIAFCLFKLGKLDDSAELAKRVHHSGVELGDSSSSGFSLDVWAWSTGGQVPADILQTEMDRPREDIQVSAQVMMAEGVRLFMLDRVEEAAEVFEYGHKVAEDAGLQSTYVLPLRPWLASALRRQAEKMPKLEPSRAALLKRADKVVKKAVRVARKFQTDLPHALREAGLLCALLDSDRRARKYLDESLEVAQQQGNRFEHAQTLLARGRVGLSLDWPGAEEDAAEGRDNLIEIGADFALNDHTVPLQAKDYTG